MTCWKVPYRSRQEARKAIRMMPAEKGLREYRCPDCDDWHVGHMPRSVRRGRRTSPEIYKDR